MRCTAASILPRSLRQGITIEADGCFSSGCAREQSTTDSDRQMNLRAQANAEFLARELASARISLGRMEAALARIESEQRERDEREERERETAEG